MINALAASAFILIGDSMSANDICSWPDYINDSGNAYVQVHAQPGRLLADHHGEFKGYDISDDLLPWGNLDTVVLWLGANDIRVAPEADHVYNTQTVIDDLNSRGFRVIYILPPVIEIPAQGPNLTDWSTTQVRYALADNLTDVEILDMDIGYETYDGVHPTCEGHREIAGVLAFWLYLMGV